MYKQQAVPLTPNVYAQMLAEIDTYCELTGRSLDQCMLLALQDFHATVVKARISQYEKRKYGTTD